MSQKNNNAIRAASDMACVQFKKRNKTVTTCNTLMTTACVLARLQEFERICLGVDVVPSRSTYNITVSIAVFFVVSTGFSRCNRKRSISRQPSL